jgi:ATP adenylyltransferase
MQYILGKKPKGCPFCIKVRGRNAKKHLVLYRGSHCYVVLNNYPYTSGHAMVASSRHVANLEDLSKDEMIDLFCTVQMSVRAIKRALNPQGFNVGVNLGEAAGAGVKDHLHVHIVPRWSGDLNFMPVVGDTKVMPEYVEATYEKLRPSFEALP